MQRLLILVCLNCVTACETRRSAQADTHGAASRAADTEPQCSARRHRGESAECYAVRCAEDFVLHHGYTIDPAAPTLLRSPSERQVVEARRGTFNASAIVHQNIASGHLVGFRYRDSSDNVGRAVTMSTAFRELTLLQRTQVWPPDSQLPICEADASPE